MMTPEKNPLRAAWEIERQPRHDFEDGKIGLGVFILQRDDRVVFWHGGTSAGFRSYLEWSPQPSPRALAILVNGDAFEPYQLVAGLHERKEADLAGDAERLETPLPLGGAADYAGVYRIDARASFTVVSDAAGRLRLRPTGQPFYPIFNAGNDRFFLRAMPEEFQFHRSPDGRVSGVTRFMNLRYLDARRTADPVPVVLFPGKERLKEYAGRYALQPGIEVEVTIKDGWLFAKQTGQPAWPVFSDQPDHFVYDVMRASLAFERDGTSAVTALVLRQNGRQRRAEKLKAD
jgi:hypothetical protein